MPALTDPFSAVATADRIWLRDRDIAERVALSQAAIRSSRDILNRNKQPKPSPSLDWQQQPAVESYEFAMSSSETEVEMVQRHVRQGLTMVARQHEIIARLRAANHSTKLAEDVLASFQTVQKEHEAHLIRITK